MSEKRLDEALHLSLFRIYLSLVAAELNMYRAGCAGRRGAEGLTHHVGDARDVVNGDVHLGHRLKGRHVVDFLVDPAELSLGIASAGHGDHGRMRQVGVAQARGEIESADDLRHADAGFAGGAGVAIGHICRGFLTVAVDTRDIRAPLHLGESPPQHRRYHEYVGDAVAREHIGKHLGAGAPGVMSERNHHLIANGLIGEPTAPVIGMAGATNRKS